MRWWNILRLRWRSLVVRRRVEDELDEELRYHLARQIEADIASGMTADEARRGTAGVEQRKEECRDARGLNLIDNLGPDLRFAARQLLKSPGFSATAVLMIALGMAASVAIAGFVDAALVKPLPYREPARLVNVTESTQQNPRANLSYHDYLDWKRLNTVLSSLDVHNGRGYKLRTASGTELVTGATILAVSASMVVLMFTPVMPSRMSFIKTSVAFTTILPTSAWSPIVSSIRTTFLCAERSCVTG
jgi:hypothetical protein